MDVVDTFNHLIPSDQLEESLLLGQNLEGEASDEFGTGHLLLEDSLKNMLSDKDPMLGSASAQFHLEDASFEIADPSGLSVMSESERPSCAPRGALARPRGRPRKTAPHPPTRPSAAEQEQPEDEKSGGRSRASNRNTGKCERRGVKQPTQGPETDGTDAVPEEQTGLGQSSPAERESAQVDASSSKASPSMNPVVVLRRLTVTVGGYKIELLPGPSKSPADADGSSVTSLGFLEGSASVESMDISGALPGSSSVPDSHDVQDSDKGCASDVPTELGPYVNPNDVQEGPSVVLGTSQPVEDKKPSGGTGPRLPDPDATEEAASTSSGQPNKLNSNKQQANKTALLSAPGGRESLPEAKGPSHKQVKSKLSPAPAKKKSLSVDGSDRAVIGSKNLLPGKMPRGNVSTIPGVKGKQEVLAAKRRTEHLHTYPPSKMQRMQEKRPVKQEGAPKLANPSHSLLKRPLSATLSLDGMRKQHSASQTGNSKAPHPPFGPKPPHPPPTSCKPSYLPREPLEEDDEKVKVKKPEKGMQRQRTKSTRSLSMDEPPLFIPDNAPVMKKEAPEEDPAEGDAVWDPTKHCGFCKKPHSNRFMVGCGRCDDWFHGECVGLELAKVQQMEKEDQEYVCLKCCAEEDQKIEPEVHGADKQVKEEQSQENKPAVRHDRRGHQHAVMQTRKDLVDRRCSEDRDAESKSAALSEHKGCVSRRAQTSTDSVQKTGAYEQKKSKLSPAASKKPSVEQIRRNVRDSLKDILLKRIKESDLKISAERAANVATKTEKELFAFFRDTDSKYKSKYRSLMFNLKDAKNNVLFKRVLKGEISPHHLIRMTPEELASKELAAWRQRENRHTIEMIEKEQREADRRPITKITHKGEIEIENQEPEKEPETVDIEPEPVSKPPEEPETTAQEKEPEMPKDTTSQHKAHLFDLNCKICTGRMAPPVEDAATKVVKVATTVMRRQSSLCAEPMSGASSAQSEESPYSAVEDSLVSPRLFSSADERLSCVGGREDETTFLTRLESLWKGFVNMPSVAKFVTKAYPVSGILDHLTEDLPDSIQVGGRISPHTVWDYVEKIRASGTKEVCVIRFSPVTEEDEISYTLLYAYFSSRRRYGVVANNTKQVKDLYLIPLGSSEKIPHQLVPFDGPGLEANRPNILLGLVIRQRVKRDFGVMSVDIPEASSTRFLPENRPVPDSGGDGGSTHTGEDYLNSLKVAHPLETAKPLLSAESVAEAGQVRAGEGPVGTEGSLQEPTKPLRFLPGVLVGKEGQAAHTADVSGSMDKEADRQTATGDGSGRADGSKRSPASNGLRLDRFIIKKKEPKLPGTDKTPNVDSAFDKGMVGDVGNDTSVASLKEKLPDASTETSPSKSEASKDSDHTASPSGGMKHDVSPSLPVTALDVAAAESSGSTSQPGASGPAAGICQTSPLAQKPERQPVSAESSCQLAETRDAEQEMVEAFSQECPQVNAAAAAESDNLHSAHPAQHTPLQQVQTEFRPLEDVQNISTITSFGKTEDRMPRPALLPTPLPSVFSHTGPRPLAPPFPPIQTTVVEFQYQQAPAPAFQSQGSAPPPYQPLSQSIPPGFTYPCTTPGFPPSNPIHQHATSTWAVDRPLPGTFQPSQHVTPVPPLLASEIATPSKEHSGTERRYSDPQERQEGSEQHSRPRYPSEPHHERKSRQRECGKHPEKSGHRDRSRSHSRSRSRSRERHRGHDDRHRDSHGRHRSHSGSDNSRGDRHHERWKDRHHGERDKHRERERDKHRRDSHDKGRRSPKERSKDRRS